MIRYTNMQKEFKTDEVVTESEDKILLSWT
jgi:hypothetical protein